MSYIHDLREKYEIAVFGTGFKRHILKIEKPYSNSFIICGKKGNWDFMETFYLDSPKENEDMIKYPHIKCQKCFKKMEELVK